MDPVKTATRTEAGEDKTTKSNVLYLAIGFAVGLTFLVFLFYVRTKYFKMKYQYNVPPGNHWFYFKSWQKVSYEMFRKTAF